MPSEIHAISTGFVFTSFHVENDHLALLGLVEKYNQQQAYDIGLRYKIGVIIDELVTNSIMHGGCKEPGKMLTVSIEDNSDRVIVTLVDTGLPFDPTSHSVEKCNSAHDDVSIGGMGICLVRRLSLSMQYSRKNDCNHNIITIGKTQKEDI